MRLACVGLEGSSVNVSASYSYSTFRIYVGGICGYNNGNISNCYSTGDISASDYHLAYVGGICGSSSASISNCYNTGSVSASSAFYITYAGGICGSSSGSVNKCYNTGEVSASDYSSAYAGGICGSGGFVKDCYNTGNISAVAANTTWAGASAYAGGICSSSDGEIINCYNTGNVSANTDAFYAKASAGGICSYGGDGTNISNCYWNIDSAQSINNVLLANTDKRGVGEGTDSTTKLTTAQMKEQSSFAGFDFNNIWSISASENNGYPFLRMLDVGNIIGDVNFDGEIDVGDVNAVYLHVRGKRALSGNELLAADVNKDGVVDIGDVNRIYLLVRGKVQTL